LEDEDNNLTGQSPLLLNPPAGDKAAQALFEKSEMLP